MSYWIKDAIEGKESAHKYFLRFGRGSYGGRGLLSANIEKRIVKGSFENVPGILVWLSQNSKYSASGKILSKDEIDNIITKSGLKIIDKKKKGLLFEYSVSGQCSELSELGNKAYFLLLDANSDNFSFKCKKVLPKPSMKGEMKIKPDFFTLNFKKPELFENFKKEFFFDLDKEAKKIEITHDIIIEKINTEGLEHIKDFEALRIAAKREGKIIRKIKVDSTELIKEYKIKI
ncbi:MAG: hypothetical protein QXS07_01490 [Candidatus Pacearchaeota archaeon]